MAREKRSSLALVKDKETHACTYAHTPSQVMRDSDCALASNESNTSFT